MIAPTHDDPGIQRSPFGNTVPVLQFARLHRDEILLIGILVIATGLYTWGIGQNGWGNAYYAATVKSMLAGWQNWFFGSFDPTGYLTVDKPPLGFWAQTLSVRIFGFNGVALILPQALAGIASVLLLYRIVARSFTRRTALLAAFLLAISPIVVVTMRSNIPDGQLVFTSLLAAWLTFRAIETGATRWLCLAGACVGAGFMIKMLEAYLIVPAIFVTYALASSLPWRERLRQSVLAILTMLTISLAWPVIVQLVPAGHRPYIGSSYHNSVFDLIWLYNGIQRLVGTPWSRIPTSTNLQGVPGIFRLITPQLAGQSGWFLPSALFALVASVGDFRRAWYNQHHRQLDQRQSMILFWGLWLLPLAIFISSAHFFNVYYLSLLAPALAALCAIGMIPIWASSLEKRRRGWVLLAGLIGTAIEHIIMLRSVPTWQPWLVWLVSGATLLLLAGWLLSGYRPLIEHADASRLKAIVVTSSLVIMLAAPVCWTLASLHPDDDPGFPHAGPASGSGQVASPIPPLLLPYLNGQQSPSAYLIVTLDANTAAPLIVRTNAPVIALGGFSGYDPAMTPDRLATLVARGTIHIVSIPSSNLTNAQVATLYPSATHFVHSVTSSLTAWIGQHCQPADPLQWYQSDARAVQTVPAQQLYICGA